MAKASPGWFTDPSDSSRTRWWNGWGWTNIARSKERFNQDLIIIGLTPPDYDYDPENIPDGLIIDNARPNTDEHANAEPAPQDQVAVTVPDEPGEWVRISFFPGSPRLMVWIQGNRRSEFFASDAVVQSVVPDFIINGGTLDLVERWNANTLTPQEIEVAFMLMQRTHPDKVREMTGDSAPSYNNGPNWITEPGNPSIANWWDGDQFTGERELVSVLRQQEFDATADVIETVSTVDPPEGAKVGWHLDPQSNTDFIHWGGLRWDKRSSVEESIRAYFEKLSEQVPPQWTGVQQFSPRHAELIEQLQARVEGVEGWYKEPHLFDNLSMRYWTPDGWTHQTSVQHAGWYDDPWNDEQTRQWDGQKWTDVIKNKEAERIRAEKAEARKVAAARFVLSVMQNYAAENTPEKNRQRRIDAANDHSRNLRNAAAVEQEQFYRDRQKAWWK